VPCETQGIFPAPALREKGNGKAFWIIATVESRGAGKVLELSTSAIE
jgi:hypothetical protein